MNSLKGYEIKKIGSHRGSPRIWLEGAQPRRAGFTPQVKYDVTVDEEKCLLRLVISKDGARVVSKKTSKSNQEIPVIDLNSKEILKVFKGLQSVRVIIEDSVITILPVASQIRAMKRMSRMISRIRGGESLMIGSVASGIGVLDLATHQGLKEAGIRTKTAFVNEIRSDCMEHAAERNYSYGPETILITSPLQEFVFDSDIMSRIPEVEVLVAGIPCSGASVAGRAKNKIVHPEAHPDVGHLVVSWLAVIAKTNPAVIVLENVIPYQSSASMSIIRTQLKDLGYEVHEEILNAADWGMIEHRKRLCMVAVTQGMSFSFEGITPKNVQQMCVGDIMESVPNESSMWSEMSYLKAKEITDKAAGKGFKMNIVDADSTKFNTLTKSLTKRQSTGTFIKHPDKPDLLRIPTVLEHARAKGVDESLVVGLGLTFGHEVLGQAIIVPPFVSVFQRIGQSILSAASVPFEASFEAIPQRKVG
ncbi:DNA cytosine methyltransferase [Bdellovibrio sp. BCCA]|uniref:DNA cytosine methyltransferase n=1 Tax=Bdellovibrio sp. BCCA TaxID=3136281 RepID=UPI0030F32AB5